jgi:hypothetical protein
MVVLMKGCQQPYESIMAMPSSRRHRLVKIQEEIVRSSSKPQSRRATYTTGLSPHPQQPIG